MMDEDDETSGRALSVTFVFAFRRGQVVKHKTEPGRFVVLTQTINIGHDGRPSLAYKLRMPGGGIAELAESEIEAVASIADIRERLRTGTVTRSEAREAVRTKHDPRVRCSPQPVGSGGNGHAQDSPAGLPRFASTREVFDDRDGDSSVPGPAQAETLVRMVADHARQRIAEGIRPGEELVIRVDPAALRVA